MFDAAGKDFWLVVLGVVEGDRFLFRNHYTLLLKITIVSHTIPLRSKPIYEKANAKIMSN